MGPGFQSLFFDEYPLSQGQAALWFHYKFAPESVAYNLAGAVAVPEDTDLQALRRAFQRVAERHPMLRTRFAAEHGEPVQRVYSTVELAYQIKDASGWSPDQFDDQLAKEIYRPIDLEQGPTWRVVVYRRAPVSRENWMDTSPGQSLVLLVFHHILGDLWSSAIILSEVAAFYRQEIGGAPASLKPLRASYAEYVKKEIQRLASPQAEASLSYWRAALSGELSPLRLPIDRPRLPVSGGRGAAHSILLDKDLSNELRALAEKQQVALYTLLLAAFQILLHRYTGQDDILVGFPKAGRSPSTVRVVGYFVNQMVVRADFSANPVFTDLLQGIQQFIKDSARHDWYPFSLLVQHLQPDRDLSRSPLIQAVFAWQQAPRLIPGENAGPFVVGQVDQAIELNGLMVHSFYLPQHVAPFDLMMLAAETPDGLAVTIEYATDLFDSATIARMAECYRTLLKNISASPERLVSDFSILPPSEREKLVETWNATAAPYPNEACLQQLFEVQAQRTPNMTAVADAEEQLTYSQLNRRANQLAHYLQSQGVGPDSLVAVCLEPSARMVIALLGILKAGGAYLPLDPANPRERLAFMLADACPSLLIAERASLHRLPDFSGCLFLMDADGDRLRTLPQTNPSNAANPDHLAYVIYTSGSTGQPKGVALAHRGVVNLLCDFQSRQAIQPGDACSWWTNPGFDVSVYEIFSPLLAGGRLQVIPQNLRLDASRLLDWLSAQRIRSAYLPPFFLEDFAAWLASHPGASSLRRLLVGVEPILDSLLAHIHKLHPSLSIINGYGPTETTICSTLYPLDSAQPHPGNTPIGKPVANTQIYLLDRDLQPVPVGVVGELYIGGVGLARGYLNQPDLTAQRFIPSLFRSGQRLYRTGDLARFLPDGNLMYVGRSDHQVKLHGVRIELGEIEAALVEHPRVKRAAVVLHKQPSGSKRLVAYTMDSQGPPPSPEELRQFLEGRLPHAMIPAAFVALDALPLTPNGKLDRKALPIPQVLQQDPGNTQRLPRTKVETALVAIWQQVLGVESVEVDDNFFELGGDSIMSLQIIARAAEAGIHLRPQQIFQAPTIAGLAALAGKAAPVRISPQPEGLGGMIPLTPIQHWFFEQNFPDPNHWNQSLMFVTSQPLDPILLRSAISALLRQHDALRLRFRNGPSGWQQTCVEMAEEIPFEVINLSGDSEPQQAAAVERHVAKYQHSLNLAAGPLIRVVYFDLGANRAGRLLIVIHHLAVDAVSWRILLEDLESAYRQSQRGQPLQLHPEEATFQAWARRLAYIAQTIDLKQEAGYWLRIAETCSTQMNAGALFPDRPMNELNTEGSVGHVLASLGREETQTLLREAPVAYGTGVGAILLTALVRALQHWTGEQAFWIDLEAHGREDLLKEFDLSRAIGWFTSLYPVRLTLPPDAGPGEAIRGVKEQLSYIPHHGLGYGLSRYLGLDPTLVERLKAIPAAPVAFNYLGRLSQVSIGNILSGLAPESIDPQRCPGAHRAHLIEIDAVIVQGALRIDWSYSSQIHTARAIEHVAELFINELRHLIAHLQSLKAAEYTPSDFPGASLSQAELDAILQVTSRLIGASSQRNLEAIYPLSPMQQGMLFHTLYAPESGIYFEQTIITLKGKFDFIAFEKAWQQVIERHASLRTSFVWQGLDRMLQVIHKRVKVPCSLQDWRDIPVDEQQARLERLFTAERRRGFNLSVPPLLRLISIQTGDDTYHIVLNHHHALLDGWSIALLFKEIFAFYDAFTRGRDLELPPPRPFQDYIAWLQSRDLNKAEAFWRKELDGYIPLKWGSDQAGSAPPGGAARPAAQEQDLPIQKTAALQAFARQGRLTLSTLVQGAWAILLGRYFKRDDVLFGITISGRSSDLPGSIGMIGLFINTLPLRVRLTGQVRLVEWLQDIQEKFITIQQYDYTPLAQIQTWSGVPRNSTLFDTLLVFENYPNQIPVGGRVNTLQIADMRSIEQTTYPLTVAITPGQKLKLRILYDPARFEPQAIQHLMKDLCDIFEWIVANPNQGISQLCRGIQFNPNAINESFSRVIQKNIFRMSLVTQHQPPARRYPVDDMPLPVEEEPPSNPLQKQLVQQWQKLLEMDHVGVHDNFFQLGGDSLTGAICISQLQNKMHEAIPLTSIFETPTVFELAQYLERHYPAGVARLLGLPIPASASAQEAVHPTPLVRIQPKGSKAPLFCIHPAGGIVFPYYTLAAYLGKEQPLYGIQDPGLYDVAMVPKSIEAMAAGYLQAIQRVHPEGPYHLLGWSAGGVIAYEMAQQLSRQGYQVASLIMLDTHAPAPARVAVSRTSRKGRWLGLVSWIERVPHRMREDLSAVRPTIRHIRSGLYLMAESAKHSDATSIGKPSIGDLLGWALLDTWRAALLREAEVANMVSQETSLSLIEMPAVRRILRLVREHRRLARRYKAETYPGQVILFRAVHTGSSKSGGVDPAMGWSMLADKGVELRNIQANHVALLVKPHVEILAQELKTCLEKGS